MPTVIVVTGVVVLWATGLIGITNEEAAGECGYVLLWERCWQVPLHTFAAATGLRLPPGTVVQSSESDGWDFFHNLQADGDLILPAGAAFPISGCVSPLGIAVTRLRDSDAVGLASQWKRQGVRKVIACELGVPHGAGGWLVEGLSSSGRVQIHVAIEVTHDWTNDGPVN